MRLVKGIFETGINIHPHRVVFVIQQKSRNPIPRIPTYIWFINPFNGLWNFKNTDIIFPHAYKRSALFLHPAPTLWDVLCCILPLYDSS